MQPQSATLELEFREDRPYGQRQLDMHFHVICMSSTVYFTPPFFTTYFCGVHVCMQISTWINRMPETMSLMKCKVTNSPRIQAATGNLPRNLKHLTSFLTPDFAPRHLKRYCVIIQHPRFVIL